MKKIKSFLVKGRIVTEFSTRIFAELILRRYIGNSKKRAEEGLTVEEINE